MNLLKSAALFLWMLGSSAWLCVCYLQLQKHQKQERKPTATHTESYMIQNEKTQLLNEWEDQIWEYTNIDDL